MLEIALYCIAAYGLYMLAHFAKPLLGLVLLPLWMRSVKRLFKQLETEFDMQLLQEHEIPEPANTLLKPDIAEVRKLGFEALGCTRNRTFIRHAAESISMIFRSHDLKTVACITYIQLPQFPKHLKRLLGSCADWFDEPKLSLVFECLAEDGTRFMSARTKDTVKKVPANFKVQWLTEDESAAACFDAHQHLLTASSAHSTAPLMKYADLNFYLEQQRKQKAELNAVA